MGNDPFARARLLLVHQRYALAAKEVGLQLTKSPDNAEGHVLLAICYAHLNDDRAMAACTRAVELEPNNDRSHFSVGFVAFRQGRLTEAEAAFRRAIAINFWDADYFGYLAGIQQLRYQWNDALQSADQGLALQADNTLCLNYRARALTNLGRHKEAAATLTGTLEQDPNDSFTHANRGWSCLHEGNPKLALVHFREAVRLDPTSEWAKEGMLEALRAKNWLYRQLLGFFLKLSRFPPRIQMLLIFGMIAVVWSFSAIERFAPAAKPFLFILTISYLIFVLATWFSKPLINMVLLTNRDGRKLLSRREIVHSCFVTLLAVAVIAVWSMAIRTDHVWWVECGIVLLAGSLHYLSAATIPNGRYRWMGGALSVSVMLAYVWFAWETIAIENERPEIQSQIRDFQRLPESEEPDYLRTRFLLYRQVDRFVKRQNWIQSNRPVVQVASVGTFLMHIILSSKARRIQFL